MPAPPDASTPLARRVWLRLARRPRLAWLGASLALVLVLRALLPLALEAAIPWAARRSAGVRVELENVDLGLFAGTLALEGLRVAQPDAPADAPIDPATALLRFERLAANLGWRDLLSRRLRLEELRIEGPGVSVFEDADGALTLPEPTRDSEPAPEETDPEASGWDVVLERLELDDLAFRLHAATTDSDVLDFHCRQLAIDALALTADGIDVGGVALDQPQLAIQRNWVLARRSRTAAPSKPPSEPVPAEPTSPPPAPRSRALAAGRIDVESADFVVHTARGDHRMGFHFAARDVSAAPDASFPVQFELRLDDGRIALEGTAGLTPVAFEGRVVWSDLALRPLVDVAQPELVPWLRSGASGGELDLKLRTAGPDAGLSARGRVGFAAVDFVDPEAGELAVAWERLDVALREVSLPLDGATPAARVAVERVSLVSPRLLATRPPDAVERLLAALDPGRAASASDAPPPQSDAAADDAQPAPDAPAARPAEPAATIRYRVDAFELRDGGLRLVDRSVSPTHETPIDDLSADATGLQLPALSLESLVVDARVQQTGRLHLEGSLDHGNGALQLALQRVALPPYDPFARQAGWRIASGRTSLQSALRIEGEGYQVRNELVLHQLELHSTKPGAFAAGFGLSLDLALALLRDGEGDITLEVPVSWQGDAVGLGLGSLLARALSEAIQGAITSPLRMVGAVIPGGGDSPSAKPLEMEPGSSELDEESRARLVRVAELLAERPALALALHGLAASEDGPYLARALLTQLAVEGGDFPDLEDAGFFARRRVEQALRERAADRPGELAAEDEALLERYVAAQPVPRERELALAQARAESVREELIAIGAPPASLRIEEPQRGDTPGVMLVLAQRGEEPSS